MNTCTNNDNNINNFLLLASQPFQTRQLCLGTAAHSNGLGRVDCQTIQHSQTAMALRQDGATSAMAGGSCVTSSRAAHSLAGGGVRLAQTLTMPDSSTVANTEDSGRPSIPQMAMLQPLTQQPAHPPQHFRSLRLICVQPMKQQPAGSQHQRGFWSLNLLSLQPLSQQQARPAHQ
jgi:hypothetical protein